MFLLHVDIILHFVMPLLFPLNSNLNVPLCTHVVIYSSYMPNYCNRDLLNLLINISPGVSSEVRTEY
jgi:hypothetical protein